MSAAAETVAAETVPPETTAKTTAKTGAETAPRVVHVVVNGSAGALLAQPDAAQAMHEAFAAAGLRPEFVPQDAGTLPERVRLAHEAGSAMVVVAGGDGTVACAAQVLAGTDTPLGILPFGTMNLLAKDLGLPIDDAKAAIRVLATGIVRKIDIAEVNGHVFLCASMLGLPARLARYREAQRKEGNTVGGWLRFGRAGLRLLRSYLPRRMVLRIEGREAALRVPSLTITANPLDTSGERMFARSTLDGGQLAVYVIERLTPRDLVRLSIGFLRGGWRRDPVLHELRAEALEISGRRRPIQVMNDGEVMRLAPPLRYRIRPRALAVLAPDPAAAPASAPDAAA